MRVRRRHWARNVQDGEDVGREEENTDANERKGVRKRGERYMSHNETLAATRAAVFVRLLLEVFFLARRRRHRAHRLYLWRQVLVRLIMCKRGRRYNAGSFG